MPQGTLLFAPASQALSAPDPAGLLDLLSSMCTALPYVVYPLGGEGARRAPARSPRPRLLASQPTPRATSLPARLSSYTRQR